MLSHTQLALADFQSTISKQIIGRTNNEAVLLTSMMINMLYFSYGWYSRARLCLKYKADIPRPYQSKAPIQKIAGSSPTSRTDSSG
jgi:hypothetical protein